jgi:hypothetical protein
MLKYGTKVKVNAGMFKDRVGYITGYGNKENTYGIRLNKSVRDVWLYAWKVEEITVKRKTIWK